MFRSKPKEDSILNLMEREKQILQQISAVEALIAGVDSVGVAIKAKIEKSVADLVVSECRFKETVKDFATGSVDDDVLLSGKEDVKNSKAIVDTYQEAFDSNKGRFFQLQNQKKELLANLGSVRSVLWQDILTRETEKLRHQLRRTYVAFVLHAENRDGNSINASVRGFFTQFYNELMCLAQDKPALNQLADVVLSDRLKG